MVILSRGIFVLDSLSMPEHAMRAPFLEIERVPSKDKETVSRIGILTDDRLKAQICYSPLEEASSTEPPCRMGRLDIKSYGSTNKN